MSFASSFERRLASALELEGLGYFRGDRPEAMPVGTPAAVLMLFAGEDDPELLLTVRTDTVATHRGQIALPGGAADPEDEARGGLSWTALRETEEEVGIAPAAVRVVGCLPVLWTVTGYSVTPFVAVTGTFARDVVI